MRKRSYTSRLYIIFIIFISILAFYAVRILYLQLFKSNSLASIAKNQHNILLRLDPIRGDIYDRNLHKLALACKVYSVYALPDEIDESERLDLAESLSKALKMDKDLILDRLSGEKSFVWIERHVAKEESDTIRDLDLKGIELIDEYKRFYPDSSLASHIIGFTGVDHVGLEGVELAYDGYLKGSPGWRWTVRDAKRRNILSKDVRFIPPSNGLNVILTIDEVIQHIAERELEEVYQKYKAKTATIVITDPKNGDILAMANRPTFDLNDFGASTLDARRNKALTDIYEPGSVFKIVAASCAVEKGLVDRNEEFFCENGRYFVGGRVLHDHKPHGTLTFQEIVEKSSNIGMTKVAQVLGKDELYRFIRLFGFGELSGIDIPGEVRGIVRPPKEWSATSISAVPIGQEVAVTSIQLVTAVSAIANGGLLVRPRIVRQIKDEEESVVKTFLPVVARRVLSETTAEKMKCILKGVVENGTGTNARLDRYTAAGKTGTAQKLEPDGSYSHSKFVASFVGFAPVDNPRIAILISVDEPQPLYYGGSVAAPVFKKVAADVLRYLKVEPDEVKGFAKRSGL